MYKNNILIILAILVSASQIDGQSLALKKYSTDNGLAQNTINDLLQDVQGFVWIATESGVSKFDGKRFINYGIADGLPTSTVRTIYQTSDSTLWFGSNKGLCWFENGKIKVVNSPLLKNTIVSKIFEAAPNKLWIGTTGKGLLECDGDSVFYPFSNSKLNSGEIADIKKDYQGNIWIGTIGLGAIKYDGKKFHYYGRKQGNLSDSVYSIHIDFENRIWFGTNSGAAYFSNGKFNCLKNKKNIRSTVRTIFEDKNQNIWFAYYGAGVSYFDGRKFHNFRKINGLSSDAVRSALMDLRGDLWFGTRNGLDILPAERFEIYSESDGLAANLVYSIGEDASGNIYFGHDGYGLTKIDKDGNYTTITKEDGLPENGVSSIFLDSRNNIWLGTLNGVSKYDGQSFENFTLEDGLAGRIVLCIEEDSHKNIWFGGEGGATEYTGDTLIVYNKDSGLPPDWVQDIFKDEDGTLWFATDESGVVKYNGKTFKSFDKSNGLPVNSVLCIAKDPLGNYWFGTDGGGIAKFDGINFVAYSTKDGLSADVCYSIVEENNFLYVATTKGITRIEYTEIEKKGNEAFQIYSKENGLLSSEMTQGSRFKDSQGNIWFGSHGGVVKINPGYQPNLVPPPIYITNIRILTPDEIVDTLNFENLELENYQNNFRFDYIGISYNSPDKILYKIKLEGLADTSWNETKETSASYPYLPPGHYNFLVKAKNNDGVWSAVANAAFTIKPPFYSTWWFSTIFFIFAASGIYGFYIFKTAQVKKRNLELANIVRERTKELREEKNKSDDLLMNILPESLVQELKSNGKVQPREFKNISILFTDFKGFTYTSSVLPADKLVNELNDIFKGFDEIIVKYGCEKLKTIGDAYMAGAGLPVESDDHAIRLILAAKEMQNFVEERNIDSAIKWEMRAGVHSGNVIAGVVGTKKFTYDIWGDTVNIASRMESSGAPGKINISAYTYMLVKEYFECEYRGKLDAKGKGKVDMYFVNGVIPDKKNELETRLGIILS